MTTAPRSLVERFYHDLWNRADEQVAAEILAEDFRFRGSLGQEKRGREGFLEYMRSVHAALGDYRCIIEDLIVTNSRVAARMTFTGIHRAPFFGIEATEREITWAGAAFFTMTDELITELWVLGDIDAIKSQLLSSK